MDQNYNNQPGFHLPEPSPEANGATKVAENSPNTAPTAELQGSGGSTAPVVAPPMLEPPAPLAPVAPPATAQASPSNPINISEDEDLIHKEWVNKAKAIVARTSEDPHAQNQELTKIKAQYLKERFNRDIKFPEE